MNNAKLRNVDYSFENRVGDQLIWVEALKKIVVNLLSNAFNPLEKQSMSQCSTIRKGNSHFGTNLTIDDSLSPLAVSETQREIEDELLPLLATEEVNDQPSVLVVEDDDDGLLFPVAILLCSTTIIDKLRPKRLV